MHARGAQVTGLAVSNRHPYMFSCSLDKEVKCWDMEYNKVCVCSATRPERASVVVPHARSLLPHTSIHVGREQQSRRSLCASSLSDYMLHLTPGGPDEVSGPQSALASWFVTPSRRDRRTLASRARR